MIGFYVVFALILVFIALRSIYRLPPLMARRGSRAVPMSSETLLGRRVTALQARHPEGSGVRPLTGGAEALAARVRLARAAEKTLDLQYYIWEADTTGWLLMDELRAAAARGVRVRLLLDDNGNKGLDDVLAALDGMPGFEVRLFNPYMLRKPRVANYLFDFYRLNRRMHNKAMTADGAVTILGGRNIGDIYFDYGPGAHNFDIDVLAVGTAAHAAGEVFDAYWQCAMAYPIGLVLKRPPADGTTRLMQQAGQARATMHGEDYQKAIRDSRVIEDLSANEPPLDWVPVTLFSDDPAKGNAALAADRLLIGNLIRILAAARSSVEVTSAYFVPGADGTRALTTLSERGVQIRILTNSLESTNVISVHGAYMRYRRALLKAGIRLYELRARPAQTQGRLVSHMIAGSTVSLHAKTFVIDGTSVFIGSFNFDPRSIRLNTEMGLLIESPAMAERLGRLPVLPLAAYALDMDDRERLHWLEQEEGGATRLYRKEPHTGPILRLTVRLLSYLPLERLL